MKTIYRSKLEYMLRYIDWKKKLYIKDEIDPEGKYMFHFLIKDFLLDPDTKDKYKLLAIPNNSNPKNIEAYKQKYIKQFEKINQMCIENKIYPFFKDPTNLPECERTRRDLIREVPEERLNEFFNVERFYDYRPPVYDPNNENINTKEKEKN